MPEENSLRRKANSASSNNERPRKKSRKNTTRDWKRKYLGSIEVSGQASHESEIDVNDKITLESRLYFNPQLARRRKRAKVQPCLQHTPLEFRAANGNYLGIINNDQISFIISNLIDAGVCEFEGQILSIPDNSD